MIAAQGATQLLQHGIFATEGKVLDTDAGRIAPSSRGPAGHHMNAALHTLSQEQGLVGPRVDGVDDDIESTFENLLRRSLFEEARNHGHLAFGMDGLHPFSHGLGFLTTNLTLHRMQLTIDVGFTDFIHVHQSQLADTGAREGLNRPRTDSTYPHDSDMSSMKFPQTGLTIQAGNAAKARAWGLRHQKSARNNLETWTKGRKLQ